MKREEFYALFIATIAVALIGFYVLLSPPLTDLRVSLGLPHELPGARYNETVGAADIINAKEGEIFLGRITFVYHSVFIILMFATVLLFTKFYLEGMVKRIVLDFSALATVLVVFSTFMYGYVDVGNFFWHGVFIIGLTLFFFIGVLIFLNFKPKDLLEWNIWLAGVLILIGAMWGAWLGSSFMHYRHEFLEALINSRYNPDLGEESVYWRALTSHEHAMIALALALVFFLSLKITGVEEDKKLFGFLPIKLLYYLAMIGQLFMGLAAYSVTFFGKIAHLIITPAAVLLILATLLLSLMANGTSLLKRSLVVGNIAIWVGVAAEGALTAINLRTARFYFSAPFRDPSYDWAELAYNIGHWHLLMFSWGIILLIIYMTWPKNLLEKYKFMEWIGYLTLVGYFIAMIGANLYALGNPPGAYIPNPYNNQWITLVLEPGLMLVTLGVALTYLLVLVEYLPDFIKSVPEYIKNLFK